ncbi:uncharacterized protein LOC133795356 [Humulus lupulus]|uniref:uncharacterized protein LOC133795356 n=1 Tax=Humulus lupulus TaxID=3486 RepID=UPI002B40769F|nr:uncharacterized protein LOC133795356 [Humulus lupulus]
MSTTGQSTPSSDDRDTSVIDESSIPPTSTHHIPISSNTRTHLEDPSDPYYLHHSDNPGNILVSQVLTVKNKIGFLDGSISRPSPTDTSLYNAWCRNNNIVISWILNSVSKEISASILYDDSAAEIWKDLQVRFKRCNGPHIFNLRKELMNLKQDTQTVSIYYTKLRTIWEKLSNYRPNCTCNNCTCGGVKKLQEHYHMEYIMSFLMGLKDSYSQVRGNILLMDPLPDLSRTFHLVTQEENQRSDITVDSTSSMAFSLQSNRSSTQRSDSTTSKSYPPRRNRPFCTHCNTLGHTIEKCYKLHGYPPGYKQKSSKEASTNQFNASEDIHNNARPEQAQVNPKDAAANQFNTTTFLPQLTATQYQQLLNLLATQAPSMNSTEPSSSTGNPEIVLSTNSFIPVIDSWIVDTGATRHICSNVNTFQFLNPIFPTKLILPNNDSLLVHPSGSIAINQDLVLTEVLYVPSFKYNIISVSCLTIQGDAHQEDDWHGYDNAPELAFTDLFTQKGILHQFTCVETPEQNAVAERKHQHLLNVVRSLYFQANIPIKFWSDCVSTAAYIINRIPTPNLKNKTPYEILYNIPPDYDHFRSFGCLAFASTLTAHRTKFDSRARSCVFMGYTHVLPFTEVTTTPIIDYYHDKISPIATDTFMQDIHSPHSSTTNSYPNISPSVNDSFLDTTAETSTPSQPLLRRSSRPSRPPAYLLSSQNEPQTYKQAIEHEPWIMVMNDELQALQHNNTWTIMPLPPNKHAIGCRWVYKLKFHNDGSIE